MIIDSFHRHSMKHVGALAALASNRLIAFAATSLVAVFFPIFLYQLFDQNIFLLLIWYVCLIAFKVPLLIWGAQIFSKTGLIVSMVIGTLGLILGFVAAYFIDVGSPQLILWLTIIIFGFGVASAMYWSPFHIDFAKLTSRKIRGKQVGVFNAAQRIVGVLMPIAGGFIIYKFGFSALFVFSIVLFIVSIVPLFYTSNPKVKYEFGFFETFQKMFSKKFYNVSLSMMAFGAESVVGSVMWPIFLFIVFAGNFLDIGAFTGVIVVVSIVLELLIGVETDKRSKKKMLKIGALVYSFGWVFKSMVQTVLGVFAASTFHSFGLILLKTPIEALMYERAADSGHYIDEFTTLREISLTLGRLVMVVLLIFVTTWFSITATFMVAAVVSLAFTLYAKPYRTIAMK